MFIYIVAVSCSKLNSLKIPIILIRVSHLVNFIFAITIAIASRLVVAI
jgi:hypothetical protein